MELTQYIQQLTSTYTIYNKDETQSGHIYTVFGWKDIQTINTQILENLRILGKGYEFLI